MISTPTAFIVCAVLFLFVGAGVGGLLWIRRVFRENSLFPPYPLAALAIPLFYGTLIAAAAIVVLFADQMIQHVRISIVWIQ